MNLERVEERCLNFLEQAPDPLVPLPRLLEHCQRDAACRDLELRPLLEFLNTHAEITVVPDPTEQLIASLPADSPVRPPSGPRAILNTRMPTDRELAVFLLQQLETLRQGLQAAFEQAKLQADAGKASRLRHALARTEELAERARQLA